MVNTDYQKQLSDTYNQLGRFFEYTRYTDQKSFEVFEGFKYVADAIGRAIGDGINPFDFTFHEFFNNRDPNAEQYHLYLERLPTNHILRTNLSSIKVSEFIYLASDLMSAQVDTDWNRQRSLVVLFR
jgi:hypothetical protein